MTPTPREMSSAIRFLAMDAIARVGDGHPGTPLGAADIDGDPNGVQQNPGEGAVTSQQWSLRPSGLQSSCRYP